MWHESRAEEKRLKGTMADRKKRAERRKKHYEEAQADPNQFLQVLSGTGRWWTRTSSHSFMNRAPS